MRDTRGKVVVVLLAFLFSVHGHEWDVWNYLGSDAVRELLESYPECKRDLGAWRKGVEEKEIWALQREYTLVF